MKKSEKNIYMTFFVDYGNMYLIKGDEKMYKKEDFSYENKLKMTTIGSLIQKKYSNYNFYFIEMREGLKEIKKIHIFEGGEVIFTLNNTWFNKIDLIRLESYVELKNKVNLGEDRFFCTPLGGRKAVELYIPNKVAKFKKTKVELSNGFYKCIETYESENDMFGYHVEKVNRIENKEFAKKISERCSGNVKSKVAKSKN